MEQIWSTLESEGINYFWVIMGILVLKTGDFLGQAVGNTLRRVIRFTPVRYVAYFLIVGGVLFATNLYHKQQHADHSNLFRKYGLTRLSTHEEIRNIYKNLARSNHPDTAKGGKGEVSFPRLSEDFKVLTNERLRWMYDRFGAQNVDIFGQEETAFRFNSALTSVFMYLCKGLFLVAFASNNPSLNTKMGSLCLVLAFLLFDMYNIFVRTHGVKEPFDFVYPDMTLKERMEYFREIFVVYLFMLISYKFAFETPFYEYYKDISTLTLVELKALKTAVKSEEKVREEILEQERCVLEHSFSISKVLKIYLDERTSKNVGIGLNGRKLIDEKKYRVPKNAVQKDAVTYQGAWLIKDIAVEEKQQSSPSESDHEKEKVEEKQADPRNTDFKGLVWSVGRSLLGFALFNIALRYVLK